MAITVSVYNHTTALFLDQSVDLNSLKLMLLDDSASFDATDAHVDDVSDSGGFEVDGGGWTTGGETLTSVGVTTVTTNDAMLDADDVDVTATGGDIGPADAAVIYDATSGKPLAYIDFDSSITAVEGTNFLVAWHDDGIFTLSYGGEETT
ncbi:MAG: hypothetical protein KIS96_03455 [Bauldia sp.]|nr:hypothetical protein [Bauldia sp.]